MRPAFSRAAFELGAHTRTRGMKRRHQSREKTGGHCRHHRECEHAGIDRRRTRQISDAAQHTAREAASPVSDKDGCDTAGKRENDALRK